ncbi:MAG: type II secretion system protein GspJ [Thermoguttaceae bacterium]|nr:type II secretion system protein GspJ [Thermoguttaceae bacterium]MDW8038976.1 type II secretion system protein GspJ [Thermoguttaceae bacterium]
MNLWAGVVFQPTRQRPVWQPSGLSAPGISQRASVPSASYRRQEGELSSLLSQEAREPNTARFAINRLWHGTAIGRPSERLRLKRFVRTAMTLLEVVLALALSLLVLMGLSMAIDSHLRVVDRSRRQVEQALLARTLLHRIAEDIRSAIRYDPQNIKTLVPQLSTQSLEDLAAEAGLGQMDFSDIEDPEATAAETTEPPPMPGIYGNRYELYIDLSRLPRLDQFQYELVATEGSPILDRTTEVKRVAYYVVRPELSAVAEAVQAAVRSGLVRWELDRAVSLLAAEEGTLADLERQVEPLAPEVVGLEFEYFDGQQWLQEWDSQAMGGLPVAIRIALALAPEERTSRNGGLWGMLSGDSDTSTEPTIYRMLVHLPASAPIQDTSTLETLLETMEAEQSESTNQPQQVKQAATASQVGDSSGGGGDQTGQSAMGGTGRRGMGLPGGFGPGGFGPGGFAPGGPGGFGPGGFGPGGSPGSFGPGGFGPGQSSGGGTPGGPGGRGPGSRPGGGSGRFSPPGQGPSVGPGGPAPGQQSATPPSSGSGTGGRAGSFGGRSSGGTGPAGSSGWNPGSSTRGNRGSGQTSGRSGGSPFGAAGSLGSGGFRIAPSGSSFGGAGSSGASAGGLGGSAGGNFGGSSSGRAGAGGSASGGGNR